MDTNTNTYSDIFSEIFTSQEAQDYIDSLDILLNSFYEVNAATFDERIAKQFSGITKKNLLASLEKHKVALTDTEGLKHFFTELEESLKKIQMIDLTLSVEPEAALIASMSRFFREVTGDSTLLLTIKINPHILGGAQVVWKGKYWDISLIKQIDTFFENRKETMTG